MLIFALCLLRVKNTPNSPKEYVQIVKNIREGDKVKQKIVRHIGYAANDKELESLKQLGYVMMEEMKQKVQRSLYSPEQLAEMVIKAKKKDNKTNPLIVDLRKLRETDRVITGVHEIYGSLYDMLGFDKIINKKTKKKSNSILKDIVMARIANPKSKRGNIIDLSRDFGIEINLSSVYRMMDYIDEKSINHLQKHSFQLAQSLYSEKINVLFYDCTTLYFETINEDELRAKGYSKDIKFNQSQVLLALLVTPSGLPVGYKLYKGNTFEGHTLIDALSHIKTQHDVEQTIFVADSALLSHQNIGLLEEKQQSYIVAARLKFFSEKLKDEITTLEKYKEIEVNQEIKVREWLLKENKRLIVTYSPSRAKKDAYDRNKSLMQLEKKLKKSKNPMSLVSNYG